MICGPYLFESYDGVILYVMVDENKHCLFFNVKGYPLVIENSPIQISVKVASEFGCFHPMLAVIGGMQHDSWTGHTDSTPLSGWRSASNTPYKTLRNGSEKRFHPAHTKDAVPRFEPWRTAHKNGIGGFSGPNGIYAAIDPAAWNNHRP